MAKRAVITGASAGIGRELAKELSSRGWKLAVCARRTDLLEQLSAELPGGAHVRAMDITKPEEAAVALRGAADALGGAEMIVLNAGIDRFGDALTWQDTKDVIDVNVTGFAATAEAAYEYFAGRGGGHLVGVSSVAGIRGGALHPAYSASKAFQSNFLEALRVKGAKAGLKLRVTDIRPGNVDTDMSRGQPGQFWIATPQQAAKCIADAIAKKENVAYVTSRWGALAALLRVLPPDVYTKL